MWRRMAWHVSGCEQLEMECGCRLSGVLDFGLVLSYRAGVIPMFEKFKKDQELSVGYNEDNRVLHNPTQYSSLNSSAHIGRKGDFQIA